MTFSTREDNALGLQRIWRKIKARKKRELKDWEHIHLFPLAATFPFLLVFWPNFQEQILFSRASDQLALKQPLPLLEPSGLIFLRGGSQLSSHLESQFLDGRTERRKWMLSNIWCFGYYNFFFLLTFKRWPLFPTEMKKAQGWINLAKTGGKSPELHLDSSGSPKKTNSEKRRPVLTLEMENSWIFSQSLCVHN